jgi:hypothetical protein
MVLERQPFRLDFRLRVAIDVVVREWFRFVRAIVMACRVYAESADENEAAEALPQAGIEQVPQTLHVHAAVIIDGTPVTHLGGAMNDRIASFHGTLERFQIGEVAVYNPDTKRFEPGGIAPSSRQRVDGIAAADESLSHVRTNEPGGTCDQYGMRHEKRSECGKERMLSGPRGEKARAGEGGDVGG